MEFALLTGMSAYAPVSRRPIADVFRATARAAVRFCVRRRIRADTISYLSVVFAAGAAVCFWHAGANPWLLLAAPLLCVARLWCNMLDGMVALAAGEAGRHGEIVNELPDRLSDILIFVGVAHSGLCTPVAGYGAAILAVLTAYVGVLGQAVAGRREYGGWMTKPWRMVALGIGAWIALGLIAGGRSPTFAGGWTVMDGVCLVIALGCLQTVIVRLRHTLTLLETSHDLRRPSAGADDSRHRRSIAA